MMLEHIARGRRYLPTYLHVQQAISCPVVEYERSVLLAHTASCCNSSCVSRGRQGQKWYRLCEEVQSSEQRRLRREDLYEGYLHQPALNG